MTREQTAAVKRLAELLEAKHRFTFEKLVRLYPSPQSAADLVEEKVESDQKTRQRAEGAVRTRINAIRNKFKKFYEHASHSSDLDWIVEIETSEGYTLAFRPNKGFYLRRFWQPHLKNTHQMIPTHISFTELRFFRNLDKRFFFRHLDINDDTAERDIEKLAADTPALAAMLNNKKLAEAKKSSVRETYFFTTTGELSCILMLTKMLEQHGVPNDYGPQHDLPADLEAADTNLMLIGNRRTHPIIRAFQEKDEYKQYRNAWNWYVDSDRIEPMSRTDLSYIDHDKDDDGNELVHALLTRMPSKRKGCVITIIAGNHGRAIEGVGEFITSDEYLKTVFQEDLKWPDTEPIPERFQMVFSVRIDERDRKLQRGATLRAAHPLGLAP